MKKIILVILLILGLIITLVPPLFAADYPSVSPVNMGGKTDLSVKGDADLESPGILPTNPFYFIKEWGRGLRRALTFSAISKATYEMGVADQKVMELQKIYEIAPKEDAMLSALRGYNDNVLRVRTSLNPLLDNQSGETDKLFASVAAMVSKHTTIIEAMRQSYDKLNGDFLDTEKALVELLKQTPYYDLQPKAEDVMIKNLKVK